MNYLYSFEDNYTALHVLRTFVQTNDMQGILFLDNCKLVIMVNNRTGIFFQKGTLIIL